MTENVQELQAMCTVLIRRCRNLVNKNLCPVCLYRAECEKIKLADEAKEMLDKQKEQEEEDE